MTDPAQGKSDPATTMPGAAARTSPEQDALVALSALHQLSLECFLSGSSQELVFRILNRSVRVLAYDRAYLWDLRSRRPKLQGVSGRVHISRESELLPRWRRVIAGLKAPDQNQVLGVDGLGPDAIGDWQALAAANGGTSALWVPLVEDGRVVAGIWLERWAGRPWQAKDVKLSASLGVSYAAAWGKFNRPVSAGQLLRRYVTRRRLGLILGLLVIMSLFWQVPLRVVAPCEVIPKDPWVVTAPLNGVVAEVVVQPGQAVAAGDPLFTYDQRTALEELKVARQQVEIIRSSLNRSRMQAFTDSKARAEMGLLEHRLEQEEARLKLAEYTVGKLQVAAETPGRVVIDDPHRWRGRPVVVGQTVLMVVDPAKSKLRIWLPESDNVEFDRHKRLKIILNAFPERSLGGELTYVAQNVAPSPDNLPSVMAEAEWDQGQANLRIGLKGAAVLYGEDVSLAYWLLRKPMAKVRKFLGL